MVFGMLLIGAGYLLLFSYFGARSSDRMIDLRRAELKRLTYMGVNVIQPVLDQQRRGELTEEQALAQGRDLIRRMRYMYGLGANYLFMGNRLGQVLAQPSDPQMEGSNQLDRQDAGGRFITREFIQVG